MVLNHLGKDLIQTRDQIRAGDEAETKNRVAAIEAVMAQMVAKAEALKNLKIGFDTDSAKKSLEDWRSVIAAEMAKKPITIPIDFKVPEKGEHKNDKRVDQALGESTTGGDVPAESHAGGGIMGDQRPPPGDNVLSWFNKNEGIITTEGMGKYGKGLPGAINSGKLPEYVMGRSLPPGGSAGGGGGNMSPTVINMPGVGSFPMQATPDVLAELKTALNREALRRGAR